MINSYPCAAIENGVYEIDEFGNSSMFLIEGSDKALLIDTGIGIGNLPSFIRTLTDKPVDVFLTHNHRDHTGGAPLFGAAYMSSTDLKMGPVVRETTEKQRRLRYAHLVRERRLRNSLPAGEWTDDDVREYSSADEPHVKTIDDGFVFDLGGRFVTCYAAPGHTPGSMVAVDSKTGILFSADSVNGSVGIAVRDAEGGIKNATVEEARNALNRIWNDIDFDRSMVYSGHSDFRGFASPLNPGVFPGLLAVLDEICAGTARSEQGFIPLLNCNVDRYRLGGIQVQYHSNNIR